MKKLIWLRGSLVTCRLPLDYQGQIVYDIGRAVRGPVFDSTGKVIEPGEILAEILVPELEDEARLKHALVRQTAAEVEQSRKALAAAEANIARLEAATVEARALSDYWESQSRRMAQAVKSGTVETQIGDETLNQLKAAAARVVGAEAGTRKAKADRDKASADVHAAEAHGDVAKADAERADSMLAYAKIRAPYTGIVTMRKVNTGDFVQPATAKGEWLFTVARLDPVRVVIGVPEADAELVQEKAIVKLTIAASTGPHLEGTVTRTSWALEPATRTLRTEIDLPNKEGRLRPGMYVAAHLYNALPEAWVLPATALAKQPEGWACYLVEGGKAIRTPVVVGRGDGQFIQVQKWQAQAGQWLDFTGKEAVAERTTAVTAGQAVP